MEINEANEDIGLFHQRQLIATALDIRCDVVLTQCRKSLFCRICSCRINDSGIID